MIQDAIAVILRGGRLTADEAEAAIDQIMSGQATAAQIAGFAVALAVRGETADEVAGCARAMRRHATRVEVHREDAVDNCGTGGDGLGTFNISTTAAFVAAGAGCAVAKHGNRAASSRCGSAEVLEAAGVSLAASPQLVGRAVDEIGIGFLFAPHLHGALKHAAAPRRELGVRTVFNLLGPLANPAGVRRQVVGVARREHLDLVAHALLQLGVEHALVLHGAGGADELTLAGENELREVRDGEVRPLTLDACSLGLGRSGNEALLGGEAAENAQILKAVLEGAPGPRRDVVLLNAAATIYVSGLAESIAAALPLAVQSIDAGAALGKLKALADFTQADLAG
ncbi:MAG: anthranilate phosphoribosyltransferase [Thermaerobacter sp.]|nr:anthranilate phosphoribosyltransferase [Thermaerobacter sp.]